MTLSLDSARSWRGFLDLLRPPPGYRLQAAIGTSYGMTFDALVAALLAMLDAEGADLVNDPAAGVIAATRLSDKVRVLVQAGSIAGTITGIPSRLAVLLDRLIVPIRPSTGLFHPKLWVLHYAAASNGASDRDKVRIVVGSRNLTTSHALELGCVVHGRAGGPASAFSADIADAVEYCLRFIRPRCQPITALSGLLRTCSFSPPAEGNDLFRLFLQRPGHPAHATRLPQRFARALVLSPFLGSDFVGLLLARAGSLRLVSTPSAFRDLPEASFTALMEKARQQGAPVMYVLSDDLGGEDTGYLDGLHAKAIVVDQGKGGTGMTFLGSPNATAPAWGLHGGGNVESMIVLEPGIPFDRLVADLLLETKDKPRPWMREYELDDRTPLTSEEKLQERLEALVKRIAAKRFALIYDHATRTLTMRLASGESPSSIEAADLPVTLDCSPIGLLGNDTAWRPLAPTLDDNIEFPSVALEDVSALVVIRGRAPGARTFTRIASTLLELRGASIAQRDEQARLYLTGAMRPAQLLALLFAGFSGRYNVEGRGQGPRPGPKPPPTRELFSYVPLERILQAIAAQPSLVREMKLLLAGRTDDALFRFQQDLEAVLGRDGVAIP